MKKLTYETEEGDILFAVLARSWGAQPRRTRTVCWTSWRPCVRAWWRLQGAHNLVDESEWAFREVNNWRALHVESYVDLKKSCQRTAELKCKVSDAHERIRTHRERCRRVAKEHTKFEAAVNSSLGCQGWFVEEKRLTSPTRLCGASQTGRAIK